jgi:hypothetical protein
MKPNQGWVGEASKNKPNLSLGRASLLALSLAKMKIMPFFLCITHIYVYKTDPQSQTYKEDQSI